jgi:chromosome segregation ATPase
MSVDQVYIIDDLKEKFQSLRERLKEQKNSTLTLDAEKKNLEDKLKDKEEEIKELKQQNNTLKLAKAFTAESEESQDAKLQINRIVREIDKCIALLNR